MYRKVEVEGADSYLKFEEHGQKLEAIFLKTIEETGEYGPQQVHLFRDPEGRTIGVRGNWDLNRKMLKVEPETQTRVTYARDVPTKKGNMREYEVEIDLDALAPTNGKPAAAPF